MKRTLLLTAIISFILLNQNTFSQSCIYCNSNTIADSSSAIGAENISTGKYSLAGGFQSEATDEYSFAFGDSALSTSRSSIALGAHAEANGWYSTAIGRGSLANGDASFALGYMNIAQAESSYLFGEFLKSTGGGSITLGFGTGNDYLTNNLPYSLMVGFNSDIPTLFVGGSSGAGTTGNVGIGLVNPDTKLEVDGKIKSSGENSALILQSPDGTEWEITIDNSGNLSASITTAIPESIGQSEIVIYPNPTLNNITIDLKSDELINTTIELYMLSGQLAFLKKYKSNLINLDLTDFDKGTYILKVKDGQGQIIKTEKIIKE